MTTFTSDDREEEYKKILEMAPASPPHIVDSGASVMGMSALELADAMMTLEKPHPTWTKAANMLRQQQVEIEMLRNQLWNLKSEPWGFDKGAQKNESK